jgi:hypothetical protein
VRLSCHAEQCTDPEFTTKAPPENVRSGLNVALRGFEDCYSGVTEGHDITMFSSAFSTAPIFQLTFGAPSATALGPCGQLLLKAAETRAEDDVEAATAQMERALRGKGWL